MPFALAGAGLGLIAAALIGTRALPLLNKECPITRVPPPAVPAVTPPPPMPLPTPVPPPAVQPAPAPPPPVAPKPETPKTPPVRKYTQPVAIFLATMHIAQNVDYYIVRPDGSRVVGTSGRKPIMRDTKFLGYSNVFLPDWLPGQPYKQGDLRLSGGMAGGQPALNMPGHYSVQVGVYHDLNQSVPYSYSIVCKTDACNGKTLYSYKGMAHSGAPQDAGGFTLTEP